MDNIKHRNFEHMTLEEIEKVIGIKPVNKKLREFKKSNMCRIDRSWGMVDYTVQDLNNATTAAHNGKFLAYETYEIIGYEKLWNGHIAVYYNVFKYRELTEAEKQVKEFEDMSKEERIKFLKYIKQNYCLICGVEIDDVFGCHCDDEDNEDI